MFDTHFHIKQDDDLATLHDRAVRAGVKRFLVAGTSIGETDRMLRQIAAFHQVYAAVGVHPHQAGLFDGHLDEYTAAIGNRRVKAIGEIGLDYYYTNAPIDVQQTVFQRFLDLAGQTGLPAVIHCRDAFSDCYDRIRATYRDRHRFVIHCFTGTMEWAHRFLELGGYLSFNGIVTFPKSDTVREVLRQTPMDRMLFETDSPFLAPVPLRGKKNEPAFLPYVIRRAATELDVDFDQLVERSTANAMRFFAIEDSV